MDKKTALAILLVALFLSVAFTASATTQTMQLPLGDMQQVEKIEQLTVVVPVAVGAGVHGNPSLLDQPTRLEINNYIKSNPGTHFRGICDGLGLSVGVVQYHLYVLEGGGYITSISDGQNKRFFQAGAFTQQEVALISLARHQTAADILTLLSQNPSMLHRDIAASLGISSQALTWQMNQLKKAGLINAEKEGVNVRYSLTDVEAVKVALDLTSKN